MKRAVALITTIVVLALPTLSSCIEREDRCAGTSCPDDRVCIVLSSGPRCVCADPAVEVDGECVADEGGEGEGDSE